MSWQERARRALGGESVSDVEVIAGGAPPIVDAAMLPRLGALVLAPAGWALAAWLEQRAQTPIDPFAMLARAFALALTLRAAITMRELVQRLMLLAAHRRYALALAPEGLLLRTPAGETAVAKADLADIREPGDWQKRPSGRRYQPVYLLVLGGAARGETAGSATPQGAALVLVPPIFEPTPGVLAERLMRWRGPVPSAEEPSFPEPSDLGSRTYDEAASSKLPSGSLAVRHGSGWIARGPYASLIVGGVFADGLVRLRDPEILAGLGVLPLGALALCLAVPLGWLYLTRRHVAPRKGLAFVATPAEILMRTRAGVLRVRWKNVTGARVEEQLSWSVLRGLAKARRLVIERGSDQAPIRYDEAFLGIPADIAVCIVEAYRRGTALR